jgi:hypothetical protein
MVQIVMQAKVSGSIGIIVGELSFLKSSGLEFAEFKDLGQGVLVLAYGKNVKLASAEDLCKPEIQKTAIPDIQLTSSREKLSAVDFADELAGAGSVVTRKGG